ncbi:glutathione S-transferase T3-like [Zingiber officinale]|uniref:glutathione S-transferase T3-like n=1 Tax=Zingiber officinale TaxID=94328 RepID=UPI001C4CB243|nr:glutathione S-transferase T3-like [Zingiber officinale]
MDPQSGDGIFTQLLQDRDPNLLNDFVTAIPTPQTTIEGTSKKTQRAQVENLHQSGHSENDKIKLAKSSYKENENNEFTFEHCWEILRYQPKWILQKEEVKGKKRKVISASPPTPHTINLGDEDLSSMSSHWERPQGRKAKKDQEKKKNHKEEKSKQLEAVVERITNDKKQLHDEKMAKTDMLVEIEKEKIKLKTEIEKEKVKQKDCLITMAEEEKNEKILLMDISGLDEVQREYILKRRLQILQNMKN